MLIIKLVWVFFHSLCWEFERYVRGRPGGAAVKFARSASQWPRVHWFGSLVRTWHCLAQHAVVGVPQRKQRKMGTDVSQSSSAKRGGLAEDVSSGLILLKKKIIKCKDQKEKRILKKHAETKGLVGHHQADQSTDSMKPL